MHWWKFLFWNALGGIVWATSVGLVAYYSGHAAANAIGKYGLFAAIGIVVAIVVIAGGYRVAGRRIERRL